MTGDHSSTSDSEQAVYLRHTPGLQVPNRRLRMHNLQPRPGQNRYGRRRWGFFRKEERGWIATLLFDSVWAASVADNGRGPRITEYSHYADWGRLGMQKYLAGCRLNGEPITEQQLLVALADEYRLDAAAASRGGAA